MAAICLDFKWLGFWILDHIQNPDHLQPKLFSTIQNQTNLGFRSPLYSNGQIMFYGLKWAVFKWSTYSQDQTKLNFSETGQLVCTVTI